MNPEETTEPKWDRWQKDRTFVRPVVGKYSEIFKNLYEQPRVYKSREIPFKGGPTTFDKSVINPQKTMVTQAIETHCNVLAPGGRNGIHGHMNSAVFYILDGEGYDIHDGVKHSWKAGDISLVENMCVHQHFNADPKKPVRYVVFKAKPTFIFFHLFFQKTVELPPENPIAGFEDFRPEL
jgi:gentisate 1,2-dioxygenase